VARGGVEKHVPLKAYSPKLWLEWVKKIDRMFLEAYPPGGKRPDRREFNLKHGRFQDIDHWPQASFEEVHDYLHNRLRKRDGDVILEDSQQELFAPRKGVKHDDRS